VPRSHQLIQQGCHKQALAAGLGATGTHISQQLTLQALPIFTCVAAAAAAAHVQQAAWSSVVGRLTGGWVMRMFAARGHTECGGGLKQASSCALGVGWRLLLTVSAEEHSNCQDILTTRCTLQPSTGTSLSSLDRIGGVPACIQQLCSWGMTQPRTCSSGPAEELFREGVQAVCDCCSSSSLVVACPAAAVLTVRACGQRGSGLLSGC
jgi:hypothetical protein